MNMGWRQELDEKRIMLEASTLRQCLSSMRRDHEFELLYACLKHTIKKKKEHFKYALAI